MKCCRGSIQIVTQTSKLSCKTSEEFGKRTWCFMGKLFFWDHESKINSLLQYYSFEIQIGRGGAVLQTVIFTYLPHSLQGKIVVGSVSPLVVLWAGELLMEQYPLCVPDFCLVPAMVHRGFVTWFVPPWMRAWPFSACRELNTWWTVEWRELKIKIKKDLIATGTAWKSIMNTYYKKQLYVRYAHKQFSKFRCCLLSAISH